MWQRDTEGLSVIVAGHPDVDTRVITMLLEAHAYPGFSGLLKVVHASAGAVDVLRGLRQLSAASLVFCIDEEEVASSWQLTSPGLIKCIVSMQASSPAKSLVPVPDRPLTKVCAWEL